MPDGQGNETVNLGLLDQNQTVCFNTQLDKQGNDVIFNILMSKTCDYEYDDEDENMMEEFGGDH